MIAESIVFDKFFLSVAFESDEKLLRLKWKGYASAEEFKDGLRFLLAYVRENNVEYCVSDLKFMSTILPQDEEWASRCWYPRLMHSALKKHAVVSSLDFLNNAAIRRIVGKQSGFETRFFVNEADALSWVKY